MFAQLWLVFGSRLRWLPVHWYIEKNVLFEYPVLYICIGIVAYLLNGEIDER